MAKGGGLFSRLTAELGQHACKREPCRHSFRAYNFIQSLRHSFRQSLRQLLRQL